ncbi:MAG: DUF5715 family protein [Bacteroidales bacterium]|nr:DUF5715 family protein [Bacteroidales bacterium]
MFTKTHIYLFFIILLLPLSFNSCSQEKELKPIRYIGNYNKDFNDLNDLHLSAAHKIGIQPVADRDEAEHMKKQLKEIKSCKYYEVDELTHSIPFVVPEAEALVNKISKNFADSLKSLNAPHYKILITSVTRTKDDVRRLGQRNVNASLNSAHMYGTTVDISWRRFIKDSKSKTDLTEDQLKKVLAAVLRDLRKEDLCYVKHERKQACFHITAK